MSKEYHKKAFESADRLPKRELYLVQGHFYAQSEKTYNRAINAYNKLLELYPEDWRAITLLGMAYDLLEDFDKAIEVYERCIQMKVEAVQPHVNLAFEYWRKGFFDRSKEVLEDYLKNFNDKAIIRWYLARTYFYQSKFDLALAEADKSLSLDPAFFRNIWTKGDIYLCQGDLVQAKKEFQKLLEHKEQSAQFIGMGRLADLNSLQGRFEESKELFQSQIELAEKMGDKGGIRGGHLALSYLYRKSGSFQQALKECKNVWIGAIEEDNVSHQRLALHAKGLAYLGMKSIDKAQQTAKELKEMIDKGIIRNLIRLYYHLKGKIELEQEKYNKAIDDFKKMVPLLHVTSSWHIRLADSLGFAYYRAGNLEKAQEEYEKISTSDYNKENFQERFFGDIYTKAFYHLGKIYEQKGWKGKAIDNYIKFIELWKNCDPQFQPLVEDARKRVRELEGNKQ